MIGSLNREICRDLQFLLSKFLAEYDSVVTVGIFGGIRGRWSNILWQKQAQLNLLPISLPFFLKLQPTTKMAPQTHIATIMLALASFQATSALPAPETVYPEVIPGPGLPSLASLNLTSAELYQMGLPKCMYRHFITLLESIANVLEQLPLSDQLPSLILPAVPTLDMLMSIVLSLVITI